MGKKVIVVYGMPSDVVEVIDSEARKRGISRSTFVRSIIMEWYRSKGDKA